MIHLDKALGLVSIVAVALAACSSETTTSARNPDPDVDTSPAEPSGAAETVDASDGSDASANPQCNDVKQAGSVVELVVTKAALPVAAGGTLANGTYVLTSAKWYGATPLPEGEPLAQLERTTLVVRGTVFESVQSGDSTTEHRKSGTLTTSGASSSLTPTCSYPESPGDPVTRSYTATPTTLTFVGGPPYQGGQILTTYTKK
jgi:hypothetical protein